MTCIDTSTFASDCKSFSRRQKKNRSQWVIYTKNFYLVKRSKLVDLKSVRICMILTRKRKKLQKSIRDYGTKSSTEFAKVETNIEYKLMLTEKLDQKIQYVGFNFSSTFLVEKNDYISNMSEI